LSKTDSTSRGAPAARAIIGHAIRRFREKEGLTLEQLAAVAGVSYQYLCGIETGKENFSIGVLEKVAQALKLSPGTLIAAAYGESPRVGFARTLGGGAPAMGPAAGQK